MRRHRLNQISGAGKTSFWRRLRNYLPGLAILAGLVAVACTQGSYPVDIFYEMHYQQSYKSHEPPRLSAPQGAVAWFPPAKSTAFEGNSGQHLFAVNCSMCHGQTGKGDGPVLLMLKATYGYTPLVDPPDLTIKTPASIEVIVSQTARPFGPESVMPPFGKLLTTDEIQEISAYIGTSAPPPSAPTEEPPSASTEEPPPASTEELPSEPGPLEISVNGDALTFDKEEFEVAAGSEVVLIFNNVSGVNTHNWVVVQAGTKDAVAQRGTAAGPANNWVQPGDADVVAHSKLLGPGETGEVRFAAPPAGTYQFVCTFPAHNFTMFGDLVVTP